MDNKPLTPQERRKVLEWLFHRKSYFRAAYFTPYNRQREFLDLGGTKSERLFMAGNRCGKTETGAFECYAHATGEYPPWWMGRRFDRPTRGWVCGETALATRDILQNKLCGEPGVELAFGTGMIPKERFADKPSMSRGITDAYDTIQVRHKTGGISVIRFKSYEQGRAKFQGEGLDFVWFDEEPDAEIYSEGLARLGERAGIAFMTFTPLKGRSEVVLRFMEEKSPDRAIVGMTLDDIPADGHISPAEKAKIIERYPAHEREARARGIPFLGSGRIFTTPEEHLAESPIEFIPPYWGKLWGVDIGIGHPFAAVLVLWDKDTDVLHIHHAIRMSDTLPIHHARAMKPIGAEVPVAWPKDAGDRDRGSGAPIKNLYKAEGLRMIDIHAQWPDGGYSTEAGIMEMDDRMKSGRLKVARHLTDWFEEYRFYHRKEGQIVKLKDDLMSATRIALMMKRYARNVQLGGAADHRGRPGGATVAKGIDDWDIFTGKAFAAT